MPAPRTVPAHGKAFSTSVESPAAGTPDAGSTPGAAAGGYAVTRHAGAVLVGVCRVAAATSTRTDLTAAPESTMPATTGDRWAGTAGSKRQRLIGPGGFAVARKPEPSVTHSDGDAGKKVVPGGDGDGVDGAATPPTSLEPGPTPSAPSAAAAPAPDIAATSPTVTADGQSGGAG